MTYFKVHLYCHDGTELN